jgi:hypothetical protein
MSDDSTPTPDAEVHAEVMELPQTPDAEVIPFPTPQEVITGTIAAVIDVPALTEEEPEPAEELNTFVFGGEVFVDVSDRPLYVDPRDGEPGGGTDTRFPRPNRPDFIV